MGFEAGFYLKNESIKDEDIKTVKQYHEVYLSIYDLYNPGDVLDDLLCTLGEQKKKCCYIGISEKLDEFGQLPWEIKIEDNEQGMHYEIPFEKLPIIHRLLKPIVNICSKYSERIIDKLVLEYIDKEIAPTDRTLLKDLLYKIDSNCDYNDIGRILRLYPFIDFLCNSSINEEEDGPKFKLIYWRSW